MATGVLKNVEIKGIACAVPDRIVKNEDYYGAFGEESVQKFINMTGIKTRHVALDEQCASDLCYAAAKRLMEKLNWEPSSIDGLIFISQTPDYAVPATACVLQHRLGISENCIAFDVNLGCSAYVYGVWLASTMVSTQDLNRVLLLCGDTSNFGINPNDSATAMLFGDGGTATAFERSEGKEIKYFLKTKGSGYKCIMVPAGHARSRSNTVIEASDCELAMNGSDVFSFTITDVPKAVKAFMSQYNIKHEDVDMYVFHQANLFILKHLAKKIGFPMEKLPVSIDRFGNTSGESIPLTLVDALGGEKSKERIRVLLCGFGVGLSWGGIYLEMDKCACLPMIYTNDYFKGD
ncbi:3-oxoacyl-ACP synthase III family protein [Acetivibrio cellulolyticus]|uniref:3-oxoacyl-ACP synthase III family protein n=1 Tax=Acetivibrio cellulolyticus TaxID=35830 RepID=UPI0001E2DE11|nr:ketoacyl-ACP synthase III [Acetivibrio cellulolyticus]